MLSHAYGPSVSICRNVLLDFSRLLTTTYDDIMNWAVWLTIYHRGCTSGGACSGRRTLGRLIRFPHHRVLASGTLAVFQGAAAYPSVTRDVSYYDFRNRRIGIPLFDTMEYGFHDTG